MAILYSFDIKAKILSLCSLFLPVPLWSSFSISVSPCSSYVSSSSLCHALPSVSLFRSLPFFVSLFFLPRCVQCLGSLTLAPRKSYGRNYHTAGIIIRVYASVSLCRYDYPAFSSPFLSFFSNFLILIFSFFSRLFFYLCPTFGFPCLPFVISFSFLVLFSARVCKRFLLVFSLLFHSFSCRWSRVIEISGRLRLLRVSYR